MESPTKVIAAFVGVFIAGAVFGGFFSIGIGARWRSMDAAQVQPAIPVAATPAPAVEGGKDLLRQKAAAAAAARRAQLLQVPMTWQAPMLMRRYAERLGLTQDQKQRVMPLLQRAAEDYRRVQQNTFRETAIILQRLQQDLAKELTPEQRKTLFQMEAKQREAVLKMEERQRERKANNEKRLKAAPGNASSSEPSPAASGAGASGANPAEAGAAPAAVAPTAPAATSTTSGESLTAPTEGNTTSVPEKRE